MWQPENVAVRHKGKERANKEHKDEKKTNAGHVTSGEALDSWTGKWALLRLDATAV